MTEGSDLPARERRVPYTDPGTPDRRSPARYLWWLVVMQRGRILLGSLWGSLWMCALMLPPYFMAKAIDDGLRQRDTETLMFWVVIILVTGAAIATLGILRHRTMTLIRTDAAYRTAQVVVRQVTRLGATLPRKVSVGELTHLQAGDMGRIAVTLTITGPGVGAVVAYLATAVLLFTISTVLAGVVLLGVPLLAIAVGPLLGKLHGAEGTYREGQGELTARAGDIVSGLGVLCGIGGKAAFGKRYRERSQALLADGYRVASFTTWVQAIGAGLPVIFLAVVTWISARMAASGTITVGEMVAVYGYVAALLVPVSFFIEGADDLPRGLVAARRVIDILALEPDVEDGASSAAAPSGPAALHDPHSGLTLEPGRMAALVSARLDEARAVVDRLARYTDSDATWGGVRLSDLELTEVRRRVLVADNDAHLFAGALRSSVSVRDDHTAGEFDRALRTAVAEDIVEALPDGLDTRLEAQGRNVSGGQRQRLRLVRALLADPEVLLLVEPTSALDAHTEATVAQRVLEARQGRTTLVVSTSPLILDRAARVSYLVDGEVVAVGTHGELLATHPGYRDLVLRDSDESVPAAHTTALQEGNSR
ncbi:ABC transporter ATP-binding protein [Streptomyces sp. AC550_RSS872]|uniref:ABC transporter ATP-binding protein n=1 Tax=Streptomyces sp. AC550_RSS872 TaxID=2823689 RepID=UPI001C261104|nr:ABC transporter ATP-binding protein [Streptomyces sp. AC550_RSS872]